MDDQDTPVDQTRLKPAAGAEGTNVVKSPGAPEGISTVGRFTISSVLGSGAFGDVYLARDPQLEREVALKVPRKGAFQKHEETQRFMREARSAAALQHPNICPVYEIFEEGERLVIVMGFVRGKRLDQFIQPDKPLPARQVARLVYKLASALQFAHAAGIIHRDLKPANIIIDAARKEPVVMDFGLARREDSTDSALTRSGDILGSPAYMSPEQARGAVALVGPASDIYSLGVILYELLCGDRPFAGSVAQVIGCILHVETPPPSTRREQVDPELESICLKAMSKKIEDRYSSMQEFAQALAAWLKQQGSSPDQSGPLPVVSQETASLADVSASTATVARPAPAPESAPISIQLSETKSETKSLAAAGSASRGVGLGKLGRFIPESPVARRSLAGGLAAVVLLAAILFTVRTPKGTVQFVLSDPKAEVNIEVDGNRIDVKTPDQTLQLEVGEHELKVTAPGFETVTREFTVRNGQNPALEISILPVAPPEPSTLGTPDRAGQFPRRDGLPAAAPLFNGVDLAGWQQDSQSRHWLAQDGVLSTTTGFGALTTEAQFSDFELQLEFRVQPGANSGVFLRMSSPLIGTGSECVEVQILDDTYPEHQQAPFKSGSVHGLVSAAPPAAVRPNQWHQMGIRLVGSKLRVEVNGVATADLDLTHYPAKLATLKLYDSRRGFIGLQRYDSRVEFRNITVRDMSPSSQLQSSTTDAAAESALAALAARVAPLKGKPAADPGVEVLRKELGEFRMRHYGTSRAITTAELMSQLRWPVDEFRREEIDPYELMVAGFGNPDAVPTEVVAVVGDSRWKHWSSIETVSFSRDGRLLATAAKTDAAGVAIVWDTETGRARCIIPGHPRKVRDARISPDGQYLATCYGNSDFADDADGVFVWEIESGKLVKRLKTEASALVRRVAWNSDGSLLAAAQYVLKGQTVGAAVWNTADWSLRHELASKAHCYSVDFHPKQNILATAGADSTVTLWDAISGTPLPDREPMKHTAGINVVLFSHDGQSLASAGSDKTVTVWEAATGKLRQTLSGHTEAVWGLDYSPDDREIASASTDGSIRVWSDLEGEKATSRVVVGTNSHNDIFTVAFSPDGRFLVSGGTPKAVRFWSRPDYKLTARSNAPTDGMTQAALSLDGSTLAMLGRAHSISTWSIPDRKLLAQPHGFSTLGVRGVALTPDGRTVIHPRSWKSAPIRYYDSLTGRESRAALSGFHAIEATVSADGRLLASGVRYPNRVFIHNLETGQRLVAFDHPKNEVGWVLNFTPNGKTLMTNYWSSGRLLLWDVATGNSLGEMTAHQGEVTSVDFRADSTLAVSCSSSRGPELKVWDLTTKAAVTELMTPELRMKYPTCSNCRISPDGRLIAAQVDRGLIQFWSAPGFQPCGTLRVMPEGTEGIGRLFFSANSRHLISVQWNGTFHIVRIPEAILAAQPASST